MSQEEDVFNHLYTHGSITPIEALNKYGCFRLGARIYDLRKEGHEISTIPVAGKGNRYAKYVLNKVSNS